LGKIEVYDDGTLLERRGAALRDIGIAYRDWHTVDGAGGIVAIKTISEDAIISAEAAAETCMDFTEAFRKMHDTITRGEALTVRQRVRRVFSLTSG
jgi:hypothetical protein